MELTVKQSNLSKALNILSGIANSQKSSLPITSNILLRTSGSQLILIANNLEIAILQKIPAKIETPGDITVPAKLFNDIVSALPNENTSIKVSGEKITVESGGYKSIINGVAAEDFPEMPTIDNPEAVKIAMPARIFGEAFSQTKETVSSDTSRPILTGVYWHTFEGSLYLAATDGYRLTEKRLFECEEEISAIITRSVLERVNASISDSVEELEIIFDESQVEFHIGDIVVVSDLIDGKFVDYRKLIPSSTETNIEVSKADFSRAVKLAEYFAVKSGGSIRISADEKMTIQSIASEVGENTTEIDAEITGQGGEVSVNPAYIRGALSAVSGSRVSYGFSGKLAPTVMKSPDHDDYIHIIMPVKS